MKFDVKQIGPAGDTCACADNCWARERDIAESASVLCPDSTLRVGDVGGVFSALLQVDQDLRHP